MVRIDPSRNKYLLSRGASTGRTNTPFLPRRKIGCASRRMYASLHVRLNLPLTDFSAVLDLSHTGHSWDFYALIRE